MPTQTTLTSRVISPNSRTRSANSDNRKETKAATRNMLPLASKVGEDKAKAAERRAVYLEDLERQLSQPEIFVPALAGHHSVSSRNSMRRQRLSSKRSFVSTRRRMKPGPYSRLYSENWETRRKHFWLLFTQRI